MKDYSSFRPEFQAMQWAITKKLHDYLIGHQCQVLNDSNPLLKVLTRKGQLLT